MSKKKILAMASLLSGGAFLLQGCWGGSGGLGGFWNGFLNGFPPNNLRYSIILDILNEELFG